MLGRWTNIVRASATIPDPSTYQAVKLLRHQVRSENTCLNHPQEESSVICDWYPLLLTPGTALLLEYSVTHYGTGKCNNT